MPDKPISKPEDQLIRQWLTSKYGVRIPQYALWKMSPQRAVEYLQETAPMTFKNLKPADIDTAARREPRPK